MNGPVSFMDQWSLVFNTLRLRQNGCHFPDIFKCIFLNENVWISIKISLKFVPNGPINNIPALVQIMAWRRPYFFMDICVTQPWWVKKRPELITYQVWHVSMTRLTTQFSQNYFEHWWSRSTLVEVIACQASPKPLSEPMLTYCQLDPWEQTSLKFESKHTNFLSKRMYMKMSSATQNAQTF